MGSWIETSLGEHEDVGALITATTDDDKDLGMRNPNWDACFLSSGK